MDITTVKTVTSLFLTIAKVLILKIARIETANHKTILVALNTIIVHFLYLNTLAVVKVWVAQFSQGHIFRLSLVR